MCEAMEESKWELTITKGDNGFVVKRLGHGFSVFEDAPDSFDTKDCDKGGIISLLYDVLEHFGELGSKHDAHRVRVTCHHEDNETDTQEAS